MDTILEFVQQRKTLAALIGGSLLGLLLGLAIGWWWWPVEWGSSTPANLRSDFQDEYILWVAEQYAEDGDLEQAHRRLGAEFWKKGQLADTMQELKQEQSGQEVVYVEQLAQALEAAPAPETEAEAETEEAEGGGVFRSISLVCGVGLLVLAVVIGGFLLIQRLRGEPSASEEKAYKPTPPVIEQSPPTKKVTAWQGASPLAQFVATYVDGDEHFDPSFSIETESGAFMGECGVGISEAIGVGQPSKVTALEVWLFDKNDIRTVTKVLMSDYAYHDEALRTKLAPKGEPVLVEPEKDVILDTQTLRVRARILEAEYGEGDVPPESYFSKVAVDLAAWVKPKAEQTEKPPSNLDIETPAAPPTL